MALCCSSNNPIQSVKAQINSMKYKNKLQLGALFGAMILISLGCKKMTEEHNAIGDPMLQKNVFEVISTKPFFVNFRQIPCGNWLRQGIGFFKILYRFCSLQ